MKIIDYLAISVLSMFFSSALAYHPVIGIGAVLCTLILKIIVDLLKLEFLDE
jgi:hypothetical protein